MKDSLSQANRRRALSVLEKALLSRDVVTLRWAIRALGESRTPEAQQMLARLLQRPESQLPKEKGRSPRTLREEVVMAIEVIRSWQERKRQTPSSS